MNLQGQDCGTVYDNLCTIVGRIDTDISGPAGLVRLNGRDLCTTRNCPLVMQFFQGFNTELRQMLSSLRRETLLVTQITPPLVNQNKVVANLNSAALALDQALIPIQSVINDIKANCPLNCDSLINRLNNITNQFMPQVNILYEQLTTIANDCNISTN